MATENLGTESLDGQLDLMANAMALMDQKPEDIQVGMVEEDYVSEFFEVDPANHPKKEVTVLVRFLPNIRNPKAHTINRTMYKIPNPDDTSKKFWVFSPKSESKFNVCPMAKAFFAMKDEDDAQRLLIAKDAFYRSEQHIGLIQIVVDPQHPEDTGKVYPFKMPFHIYTILEAALHPSDDDIATGSESVDVYNMFAAPCLKIVAGLKEGDRGRDFAKTIFVLDKKPVPILIPIGDGKFRPVAKPAGDPNTPEYKEALKAEFQTIINFLTSEDVKNINEYAYVPWDEETKKKVERSISMVTGGKYTIAEPVDKDKAKADSTKDGAKGEGAKTDATKADASKPTADVSDDDAALAAVMNGLNTEG